MGFKSTGKFFTVTRASGHLLNYFRSTMDAGRGAGAPKKTSLEATGGSVFDYIDGGVTYRTHTFTSPGFFNVERLSQYVQNGDFVDWLIIGGGGAGGTGMGGGGGAGGYRTSMPEGPGGPNPVVGGEAKGRVVLGNNAVEVGAGGISGSAVPGSVGAQAGGRGGESYIDFSPARITSDGGGGGGNYNGGGIPLAPGGSGGGAGGKEGAATPTADLTGELSQGYPGGSNSARLGGGGGGAASAGGPHPGKDAGFGGTYKTSVITGTAVDRAGGGGSGGDQETLRTGGGGGGANGGQSGTSGTGGGGGGSSWQGGDASGNGGSGLVVIRYVIIDSSS